MFHVYRFLMISACYKTATTKLFSPVMVTRMLQRFRDCKILNNIRHFFDFTRTRYFIAKHWEHTARIIRSNNGRKKANVLWRERAALAPLTIRSLCASIHTQPFRYLPLTHSSTGNAGNRVSPSMSTVLRARFQHLSHLKLWLLSRSNSTYLKKMKTKIKW